MRTKWQKESRNVQLGDIVLIRGEQTYQTNDWPLARVVNIHTGKDGLVRAVDVQNGSRIYCRPIAKLTVLFNPNSENEEGVVEGRMQLRPHSVPRDVGVGTCRLLNEAQILEYFLLFTYLQ